MVSQKFGPNTAKDSLPLWFAYDRPVQRIVLRTEELQQIEVERRACLEALIGSSVDFLPFYFLEQGHDHGQAISRIVVREPRSAGPTVVGHGTGFLIGPDVLLTNHHVLPDVEKARVSTAEFNY
jgi:endonuclease G, mitochondrial